MARMIDHVGELRDARLPLTVIVDRSTDGFKIESAPG